MKPTNLTQLAILWLKAVADMDDFSPEGARLTEKQNAWVRQLPGGARDAASSIGIDRPGFHGSFALDDAESNARITYSEQCLEAVLEIVSEAAANTNTNTKEN